MKYFSNMTAEEFIRVNEHKIGGEMLDIYYSLLDRITSLETMLNSSRKYKEIVDEQVYFAQELVRNLDGWSKSLPKTKKKDYDIVRENTQFEI